MTFICGRIFYGAMNMSCRVFLYLYNVYLHCIAIAIAVRLLSLMWRVRFNQMLISNSYRALVDGELDLGNIQI